MTTGRAHVNIFEIFLAFCYNFVGSDTMKLRVNKKDIKVSAINGFLGRFKCMKFVLEPLKNTGFLFEKRKFLSTYFFCQNVDVVMTDKDNIIKYMYPNLGSEKRIHYKRKVYNTYILPLNTCENLKIGEKLDIK